MFKLKPSPMSEISDRAYDTLLSKLKKLSDEADKQAAATTKTANVNKKELVKMKKELESLRTQYLQQQKQAVLAYDAFEVKFKEASKLTSEYSGSEVSSGKSMRGFIPL